MEGLSGVIAELTGDLICLCERGVIVDVNPVGRRMLAGRDSGVGIVGQSLRSFIKADYRDIIDSNLDVLVEERGLPLMLVRADGELFEATLSARRMTREGGGDVVVVHGRDLKDKVRAVNTLVANHKRFLKVVEQAYDLTCLLKDGRITFMNPAGLKLLEAEGAQSVIGHPLTDFMHEDYAPLFEGGLDDLVEEAGMVPLKIVGLQGRRADVEARVTRFRADGADAHMVEARDITARKKAAEGVRDREQRLAGILGYVGDGIFTAGADGRIQSFNMAAESIFGYRAAEVVGRSPDRVIPDFTGRYLSPDLPAAPARRNKEAGATLGREVETSGRHADGRTFPLTLTLTRLPQGKEMIHICIVRDISERKRAEERERRYTQQLENRVRERTDDLRRMSRRSELILEAAGDGIIGLDLSGKVTFINPAAERILGVAADRPAIGLDGAQVFRRVHTDGAQSPVAPLMPFPVAPTRGENGVGGPPLEVTLARLDGSSFPAEFASTPLEENGQVVGTVAILRDITDRRVAQARLSVAYTVFDNVGEGIAVCDDRWRVTMVNPAFSTITGIPGEEAVGQGLRDLLVKDRSVFNDMIETLAWNNRWERDVWCDRPRQSCSEKEETEEFAVRLVVTEIQAADGTGIHALILSDVTQRKRDEERIRFQANYDTLTSLPNRSLFMDRLRSSVALALRSGCPMGLLIVDLDGFKGINDSLGHDAGDALLVEAAGRLRECARDSDTVARLGGDEFTLLLNGIKDQGDAIHVAERVIASLAQPFELTNGERGRISASVGIALVPTHGMDVDVVLNRADKAMYRAKQAGKNAWRIHASGAAEERVLRVLSREEH
ncbi:MAG: PAS domain S-box protein [Rhodospirillum sp.]|nr:PAS domain S-box protein [Rhodospirillum sp.]MCF8489315.1 PAS domain S-box protein [Rhodospirillum sp.]MCF8500257.1 PAS domain S-box protein [Rhodospirillum sp.]